MNEKSHRVGIAYRFRPVIPSLYKPVLLINRTTHWTIVNRTPNPVDPMIFMIPIVIDEADKLYSVAVKRVPGTDNEYYRLGTLNGSALISERTA